MQVWNCRETILARALNSKAELHIDVELHCILFLAYSWKQDLARFEIRILVHVIALIVWLFSRMTQMISVNYEVSMTRCIPFRALTVAQVEFLSSVPGWTVLISWCWRALVWKTLAAFKYDQKFRSRRILNATERDKQKCRLALSSWRTAPPSVNMVISIVLCLVFLSGKKKILHLLLLWYGFEVVFMYWIHIFKTSLFFLWEIRLGFIWITESIYFTSKTSATSETLSLIHISEPTRPP